MSRRTEKIYVIKDGERIGPYTSEELLERVDRGEILYEDFCLKQGDARHIPVREVLDWEDADWAEEGQWELEDDPEQEYEDEVEEEEVSDEPEERPAPTMRRGPNINDPSAQLYTGHPALLSFPKSLLLAILALGQGVVLWDRNGWFLFAGLIVALLVFAYILFERSMKLFMITPKRVEIVHGFWAKNSNEVRIDDIRAINVKKPGLAGLIGIGNVEFASAGSDSVEVIFTRVSQPDAIKNLVRRLQDRPKAGK